MKIIGNDSCLKRQLPDSIEHLFINCEYSGTFWTEFEEWINSIGFLDYKILVDRKKNNISLIVYCYLPSSVYVSTGSHKQVVPFNI